MYEGDAEGGWGVCEEVVGVVRRCLDENCIGGCCDLTIRMIRHEMQFCIRSDGIKSLTESISLQDTSARHCHPTPLLCLLHRDHPQK